jgi:hypothetical protein
LLGDELVDDEDDVVVEEVFTGDTKLRVSRICTLFTE